VAKLKPPIRVGLEVLQASGFRGLKRKRVGLLTNPSAVDRHLHSAYDIFRSASQINLTALFAPEHGFTAAAADGEHIASGIDPRTGLPVHSLYGTTLHPTPEMLQGVDVIVCDIQDIGVRYYTFVWTISHLLEAAGAAGVAVMILDRPNPLGRLVEGPILDPRFASLVGRFPVPVRHGLTLGELAQIINQEWNATPAQLTVISFKDRRAKLAHFVPPSPNIPNLRTVRHYVGACLIEGTNLSEGRGTALPFQIVGAPFIDGEKLADRLNATLRAPVARPHTFRPTASKFAGETCYGVQIHAPVKQGALELWLEIIREIRQLYPDQFVWNVAHFDRLIGTDQVRLAIEAGETVQSITQTWKTQTYEFTRQSRRYHLYRTWGWDA
jgi:uncharacterized protein YbbC (DUF1343 family)